MKKKSFFKEFMKEVLVFVILCIGMAGILMAGAEPVDESYRYTSLFNLAGLGVFIFACLLGWICHKAGLMPREWYYEELKEQRRMRQEENYNN